MRSALGVLLLIGATAEVRALCETTTLEKQFAASSVVFVGRAIARELDEPSKTASTTFEVEEMWKGSQARTSSIRTCGEVVRRDLGVMFVCEPDNITFQVGTRYLIFARGEPLETNACLPTGVIERSQAALRWLADKPRISSLKLSSRLSGGVKCSETCFRGDDQAGDRGEVRSECARGAVTRL